MCWEAVAAVYILLFCFLFYYYYRTGRLLGWRDKDEYGGYRREMPAPCEKKDEKSGAGQPGQPAQPCTPVDCKAVNCKAVPCTPGPCTPTDCKSVPCTPTPCTPSPCTPVDCKAVPCIPEPCKQVPCAPAKVEWGIDYNGNDIVRKSDISVWDCQQLCQADPNCKLIGYGVSDKTCWLKHTVGAPTAKPNTITVFKA